MSCSIIPLSSGSLHEQVFGEQTGTAGISLSFAAVELLQPATEAGHSAYTREERSVAGHVHMRLLDLVRGNASSSHLSKCHRAKHLQMQQHRH